MKLFIASDHAGFELKQKLLPFLRELGHDVENKTPNFEEGDDYPDKVFPLGVAVIAGGKEAKGIIIGKSGQGEAMRVNRIPGIRAAVYYGDNIEVLKLSREHNDANILSLGAAFLSEEEAKEAIKLWLQTPFSGEERHKRRIAKLDQ